MHDHLRHVEAAQPGRSGPQMPFALCLIPKRAGFAAEPIVEEVRSLECFAARGRVNAQRPRHAIHSEFHGRLTVVLQRQHGPVPTRPMGQPGRRSAFPDRQHLAADVVASERVEAGRGARQPIRLHSRIVVGRGDDRATGGADPGVERGVAPLLRFEQVVQCGGKRGALLFDHRTRMVGRLVVDDDQFPIAGNGQLGNAPDRFAQFVSAVVGRDDDGKIHTPIRNSVSGYWFVNCSQL